MAQPQTCASCRAFSLGTHTVTAPAGRRAEPGECRRRPPLRVTSADDPGDVGWGVWPTVWSDLWCHEHCPAQ